MSIEEVRIKLSALWVVFMLTYLLGDVLRIFSGDFEAAKLGGKMDISPAFFLGMAALFALPIVMVFMSLVLPRPVNRWGTSSCQSSSSPSTRLECRRTLPSTTSS